MTEDEMVGCHHQFNGHEFEQAPGDGEGQGSLACGSPWGRKELDTTEQQQRHFVIFQCHTGLYQDEPTNEDKKMGGELGMVTLLRTTETMMSQ